MESDFTLSTESPRARRRRLDRKALLHAYRFSRLLFTNDDIDWNRYPDRASVEAVRWRFARLRRDHLARRSWRFPTARIGKHAPPQVRRAIHSTRQQLDDLTIPDREVS